MKKSEKCNRTAFQPTMAQWLCPNCGADSDDFYIEDCFCLFNKTQDSYCSNLHKNDVVVCNKCDKKWSGSKLATILMKKYNRVTCPCCEGEGTIEKNFLENLELLYRRRGYQPKNTGKPEGKYPPTGGSNVTKKSRR
jgi:hypothetical protein